VKVEEGICDGEIMFHEFIEKSEKEIKQIKNIREKKRYVSCLVILIFTLY
jgi:ribosome biogenesis protein SSF1/2